MAPGPTTEDLEFVHAIVHQQPAAIARLFDRYAPLVRRTLVRTLGNAVDLDDLAQDTFITVIRRAHTLRDPSALRAFVVSVAVRIARNELRKRAIRRFVGLEDAISLPVAGPLDAALVEGVRHIYDALGRLSTDARLAFVLRHVEGYELTETAAACGCSLATIKRRLSRAEARFEAIANGDPTLREFLDQARRQS
jgi:RNA polymerase sigma-70 factor (ECF subfamily)